MSRRWNGRWGTPGLLRTGRTTTGCREGCQDWSAPASGARRYTAWTAARECSWAIYQLTADLLTRLGEQQLAWVTADRGMVTGLEQHEKQDRRAVTDPHPVEA